MKKNYSDTYEDISNWKKHFESAEDFFADINHYTTCPKCWYYPVAFRMIIQIIGESSEVEQFIEKNKGLPWPAIYQGTRFGVDAKKLTPQFCFNSLVPMPQDVYEHLYEPDNDNTAISKGERWMLDNWGTDTDVYGISQMKSGLEYPSDDNKKYSSILFYTRKPPDKWLTQVSKMYPNLIFTLDSISHHDTFGISSVWMKGEIVQSALVPLEFILGK